MENYVENEAAEAIYNAVEEESEFNRLGIEYHRSLHNEEEQRDDGFYASPAYYQNPNDVHSAMFSHHASVDRVSTGRYRATPSPSVRVLTTPHPFQNGIGSVVPASTIPERLIATPFGIASTIPPGTNSGRPPTGRAFTKALQKVLHPPRATNGVLQNATVSSFRPLVVSSFAPPSVVPSKTRPSITRSLAKSTDNAFAPLTVSPYVPLVDSIPITIPRKKTSSPYNHDDEPSDAELMAAFKYRGGKTQRVKRTKI